jgi:hypothetical protein
MSHRNRLICLVLLAAWTTCSSTLEAGETRSRRSKLVCGAALLAVVSSTATWWYGETGNLTPGIWRDDFSTQAPTLRHTAGVLNGLYQFKQEGMPYAEVEILETGWWNNQVAERIKAKLVSEFPRAAELPDWSKPGLRVPLSVVTFEMDKEDSDQAYVHLSGPFLTLVSEQPVPLKDLEVGVPQTVKFKHRRTDSLQQGIELHFDLVFRYDPEGRLVDEVRMLGKLRAFGPFFEHEDEFTNGPLTARPDTQVAER